MDNCDLELESLEKLVPSHRYIYHIEKIMLVRDVCTRGRPNELKKDQFRTDIEPEVRSAHKRTNILSITHY